MMFRFRVIYILGWLSLGCTGELEPSSVDVRAEATRAAVRPLRIPSINEDLEPAVDTKDKKLIAAQLPLPSFWKKGLSAGTLNQNISRIVHRIRVSVKGPNTWRDIKVVWSRRFSAEEILDVTNQLKLTQIPKAPLGQWTTVKNRKWRMSQDHSDSSTTVLDWQKYPKMAAPPFRRCGRPHHLETPQTLPKQLGLLFRKMSTKRTIEIEHDLDTQNHETSMTLWYKNGFAQDEHIGQIQSQLTALKWQRSKGASVKQSWKNDTGLSVNWYPVREAFPMGCTLRGPLIKFSWSQER